MHSAINLTVFIICFCKFSSANFIYVYTQQYHKSPKIQVSTEQCTNLPQNASGKVLSIDTRGRCAAFYDGANCAGSSVEIMARSPGHATLDAWNFNNKTLSVGPCRDACDQAVTGKPLKNGETSDLVIFSEKDYKGAYLEMKVKDCTVIPTKFRNRVLSVKTYDTCLQFYNNVDCKYPGNGLDSIELRRGTPLHNDVRAWNFGDARAVSHCSYKCDKRKRAEAEEKVKLERERTPENLNEVFLYDAKDFKGNRFILNVTKCQDITNEWEGVAMSVKTFSNHSCVALFDKHGCEGDVLQVVDVMADLSSQRFDAMTRSIGPCSDEKRSSLRISGGLEGFLEEKEEREKKKEEQLEKDKLEASSFPAVLIIFGAAVVLTWVGAIAMFLIRRYREGVSLRCSSADNASVV